MEISNYTFTHPIHYVLCVVSFVSILTLVHFLCICVHVGNVCACTFNVKCRFMFLMFYLAFQVTLLSAIVGMGLINNNASPVVSVMEAHMLAILIESCSATFKPIVSFIELACIIVDSVVDYYVAWKHIGIWIITLNKKRALSFWVCFSFGVLASAGLVLPVVVLLIAGNTYLKRKINFKVHQRVLYVVFGGGGDGNTSKAREPCVLTNTTKKVCGDDTVSKRPACESTGKENCSPGDSEPPRKRGRKSMYAEHRCGDCSVWLQTGGDEKLLKYHKRENRMRHPGDKCVEFSHFLSCQGVYKITLRSDSCLCNACHRDCLRSSGKPRWLGLSKHLVCKHCFVCCNGPISCACDSIRDWGPVQHFELSDIKKVAECLQFNIGDNIGQDQHVCKSHYVSIHQAIANRACKLCDTKSSSHTWISQ